VLFPRRFLILSALVPLGGCKTHSLPSERADENLEVDGSGGQTLGSASGGVGSTTDSGAAGEGGEGGAREPEVEPEEVGAEYERFVLTQDFVAEGATFGDFNGDGLADVAAGSHIYLGPNFEAANPFRIPSTFDPLSYSDNFFAFTHDFNRDERPDLFIVGFPGQSGGWFENPGNTEVWQRNEVFPVIDNEAPAFVDLLGDAEPELVFNSEGAFGWAGREEDGSYRFHAISENSAYGRFTHGLGISDVNGDGLSDLIASNGIWLQPPTDPEDGLWSFEPHTLGRGGAQMVTYDVDGDGDEDVITTQEAHGYGVAWYEQQATNGIRVFIEHLISGTPEAPGPAGIALHEPHALALADVDGDGLLDIVTGERFWGHVPEEPVFDTPAQLVYFRLVRDPAGPRYEGHVIDEGSGVGTQVVAQTINNDSRPSIVVANKKGVFVFRPLLPD
jgi:hypothetical protein